MTADHADYAEGECLTQRAREARGAEREFCFLFPSVFSVVKMISGSVAGSSRLRVTSTDGLQTHTIPRILYHRGHREHRDKPRSTRKGKVLTTNFSNAHECWGTVWTLPLFFPSVNIRVIRGEDPPVEADSLSVFFVLPVEVRVVSTDSHGSVLQATKRSSVKL